MDPFTAKAIVKAATTVATNKTARNVVIIAAMTPLIIVLMVLSSPFAIFFAVRDGGASSEGVPVINIMNELKMEFENRIQIESDDPEADEVRLIYMGSEDNELIDNRVDVLYVFSTKYNMAGEVSEQVALLSGKQVSNLKTVYYDMNVMTTQKEEATETITYTRTDDDGNEVTETETITKIIKTITIDSLLADEAAQIYGFNEVQLQVIEEMKKSGLSAFFVNNGYPMFLTSEEISAIRNYLPVEMKLDRLEIVSVAESIVGKVPYFWGGKSHAIGWDSRWGTQMEVTSQGSSTTGTLRPFGLDCSGYVTWVFVNMGLPLDTIEETIGHGGRKQWVLSSGIPESMAEPGDLAFIAIPGTIKVNHVGIVVGKNEKGSLLVAHCASGANNVVVTTAESTGFLYFRRPAILIEP